MTVTYKTRDSWGNTLLHTIEGVASWTDEKSEFDPYILRILRDAEGRVLAGPVIRELFDFEVLA
jgi:hypothetical protein